MNIASWHGTIGLDYEIDIYKEDGIITLVSSKDISDEEESFEYIEMRREDLLAVIAGLNNALAELDLL